MGYSEVVFNYWGKWCGSPRKVQVLSGMVLVNGEQMIIRKEVPGDINKIYNLNVDAFGGPGEADLVDRLREAGALLLSLVALKDDEVVGHIAFSPVTIDSGEVIVEAMGLAPMAVLPGEQRRGIGSKLVEAGLRKIKEMGHAIVVVLGHPEYYPRFGFEPSVKYNIKCEYDTPEEAFMVKELKKGGLVGVKGTVRFRSEFEGV